VKLREIDPTAYARIVLPQTAELWASGRSFERYVEQTLEIAQSSYGKRAYRTLGLYDGDALVASFKRYERKVRMPAHRLRAVGIGAVFTPAQFRGRGYASAMLASALDDAKAGGFDLAYLFSDIHPQFYKALGFIELPSRSISVRADSLQGGRITTEPITERDWTAIRRCFDSMESHREWAFERSPVVWDWIRLRLRQSSEFAGGQPVNLAVRRGRALAAYLFARREPAHDSLVADEFGFADPDAQRLIPALLRNAAGDLRRVTGWLPPDGARQILPRGSVRKRTHAVWMIAPLSPRGAQFAKLASARSAADGIWSSDHI
jgi:GNAT superfamily N-acetyltransferase